MSTYPAHVDSHPARGRPLVGRSNLAERLFIFGVVAFGIVAWRPWRRALLGWLAGTLASPPVQQSAALIGLATLASIGVSHEPVFVDEANNVVGACLLAHGSVMYRDVFSHHFPMPYYLLASLGDPGACSVLAARHLGMVLVTAAVLAFTLVTRNVLAPAALLVMTLSGPSYYAQMYLAETVMSVGLILTLALLTDRAHLLARPVAFALRTIALLILASSSQLGLMMAAILGPLMLIQARGQRLSVIVAGGTALAVWPVFLLLQGALRAFVEHGILFNTQVYGEYLDVRLLDPGAVLWQALSFARHRFSFVVDWLSGQDAKATVATFAAGFELALLLLLAGAILARRREVTFRLALVLLLPLCVVRDGFHLAPFITLASIGAAHLLGGRPPARRYHAAYGETGAGIADETAVGATVTGAEGGSLRDTLIGRSRLAQAGAIVVTVLALRIYFFFLPTDLNAPDELAESLAPDTRVLQHAPPGSSILYLPLSPHGYLAADRRPGGFYSFFLPWQADVPGAEDRLIADIERQQVAVIVLDQETPVWDKYKFREYAPKVYAHIMSAYRPVDAQDRRQARVFVRAVP